MSTVQLQLPDNVKNFLEADAAAKGYSSPSDYITALLGALQRRQVWDSLEPAVLEGLASPARPMLSADWDALHAEVDR